MAHDPHHDSIIESLKEIFARYSELEDRLEFLENELAAHADFSDHATGGWREMANILDGYCVEFGGGKVRVPNVVRIKDGKAVNSYKHLRQYCTIYQEGGVACENCYDFICDACGEHRCGEPEEVVNTETLCGVVMCRDCHTSRDFDAKCTNDACPVCGGNTPERVEEQIEWMEKKIARQKEVDKMVGQVKSAATKAIRKAAEQHKEAFSNPEPKGKESSPAPGEDRQGTFNDGLEWSIDEDGSVFLEEEDPGTEFPDRIYIKPDQLKKLYDIVGRLTGEVVQKADTKNK